MRLNYTMPLDAAEQDLSAEQLAARTNTLALRASRRQARQSRRRRQPLQTPQARAATPPTTPAVVDNTMGGTDLVTPTNPDTPDAPALVDNTNDSPVLGDPLFSPQDLLETPFLLDLYGDIMADTNFDYTEDPALLDNLPPL